MTAGDVIGVGVIVLRGDRLLLGRRRGSHGADSWALPGGHLEEGETVESCARREVLEETGLAIALVRPGPWTDDLFPTEGKRYVTLFVIAESATGDPQLLEPAKCHGWEWFPWSALPKPLFLPLASLQRQGFVPA